MKKNNTTTYLALFRPSTLLLAVTIYFLMCGTGCGQSASKNVEERLKQLEATNEMVQKKLERLDAVHEIQNLMGRYVWEHEVQKDPNLLKRSLLKTIRT